MSTWWREYPDRDCEYVTYYPVSISPLSADELWTNTQLTSREKLGIYIHVPFCSQICPFCNYNKFRVEKEWVDRFARALVKEVQMYMQLEGVGKLPVPFIYFGGGTPSMMSLVQFEEVLEIIAESFNLGNAEICVEMHPTTATLEYLRGLRSLGVNRVSFGIQSFNGELLQRIGSYHTREQAYDALSNARLAGFDNVAFDLMFLLPGQTVEMWEEDLKLASEVDADHLSLYRMLLDPSGQLARIIRAGRVPTQGDQKTELAMAELCFEILPLYGYSHYGSCSSSGYDFARLGKQSIYENLHRGSPQIEYLAMGAGGAGYANGHVYWTIHTVPEYIAEIEANHFPILIGRRLTMSDEMTRFMVLGVKHLTILKSDFEARFGVPLDSVFSPQIKQLSDWGLIEDKGDRVVLTHKGVVHMDNVSKTFYNTDNYRVPQPYKIELQFLSKQLFGSQVF